MKEGDLFVVIKDVQNSKHKLFKSLPIYHQYEYMYICDMRKFGRKRHFKIELFEGPKDLTEKDGIWFGSSFSMRQYNRKRAEVPEKYYRWTDEKTLVNLMKYDIIELTTYQEIAKRFLDEERM